MAWLDQIQDFFENLDEKQFNRFLLATGVVFSLLAGIIVYRYFRQTAQLKQRIVAINRKRTTVKEILERFEIVEKQRAEVDALLAKDIDFKIGGYFDSVVKKLGLEKNLTRVPETPSEVLDNGYTEVKLYASFNGLSMKKLTELLDTIEQNNRIYTKEVEIYKPGTAPTINVNLLIATLQPAE